MKRFFGRIDAKLGFAGIIIGYGCCAFISLASFAYTWFVMPVLSLVWFTLYAVLFIPFMLFSILLTGRALQAARSAARLQRVLQKFISVLIIWFIAFFPFSLFGLQGMGNIPTEMENRREAAAFREEILSSEVFVDLTPFGLGVYKQNSSGERYLWDTTLPQERVQKYLGTPLVYQHYFSHRSSADWDVRNRGMDVSYAVYYYQETYIIVSPQGNLLYLCKELNDSDALYAIFPLDAETVIKLGELSGEQITRKELSERLGKTY